MIAKPTTGNYGSSSFLNSAVIKIKCQTESDWVKFLDKKSSTLIQWDFYWRKCLPPLLRSPGSDHIFLVGLRRATFYKGDRLLRQFKYEQGIPGGKRRIPFSPMDTNPTSIQNMLLGLEMVDRVDQSFVNVHFHKMTIEYSYWLIDKIVNKEAERIAIREQFLRDNRESPNEDNYEFKEGTVMTKCLSQKKSMISIKRKDLKQSDLIF